MAIKEIYLHYLWEHKLIPPRGLFLTNGEQIKIIDPGVYNAYTSGPDFFNSKIEIGGILWVGNVELHVESKEWFLHSHHTDKAYNNVILHVVYLKNSIVEIAGQEILTLELQHVFSEDTLINYFTTYRKKQSIICSKQITLNGNSQFKLQLQSSLQSRLNRKTSGFSHNKSEEVLYQLFARAMGSKINQLPFEEIANRIPLSLLQLYDKRYKYCILLGVSGLFEDKGYLDILNDEGNFDRIHSLNAMNRSSWKTSGAFPTSQPKLRVMQFAHWISYFDFDLGFIDLNAQAILIYFYTMFDHFSKLTGALSKNLLFSKNFQNHVIINAIVPFLYYFGQFKDSYDICKKAFDVLNMLPSENNHIIKIWKKIGVQSNSAFTSQALIELYHFGCAKKQCFTCKVGRQIFGA